MRSIAERLSLRDLSLRYKIPARATALMLITAVAVTSAILTRVYDELREDLFSNAETLGGVLGETLVEPMRNDDVWRAYEIIQAPLASGGDGADMLFLVDHEMQVFVSSKPDKARMLTALHSDNGAFPQVAEAIQGMFASNTDGLPGEIPNARRLVEDDHYFVLQPVVSDGVVLGTLVLRYPRDIHWPRFVGMLERAATVTLLVLLLLIPVSWWWGRRMAKPLMTLSDCMSKVGERIPDEPECRLQESRDEVGQLSQRLRKMLAELREKQMLEHQMMASERLAAVGRLTAGIAHEINNPLGGMLNAISTHKRHGSPDPRTERTLALLERGLLQIRDTVSALLVEARPERQSLSPSDLEDVRTLVLPNVQRKSAHLVWEARLEHDAPLPATLVRQTLINLLLNAAQAVEKDGQVECLVRAETGGLHLRVGNTGDHIPPERLDHLFEPYADAGGDHSGPRRHGMGLWMTYQIVTQLKGSIEVDSRPGWTVFEVRLPWIDTPAEHAASAASEARSQ